jgi:alginate O-acetyltransferase complex protein AlgJ
MNTYTTRTRILAALTSILICLSALPAHSQTNAVAAGSVIAGKDGRLFLADEIQHYRTGKFWDIPNARKNADPLPAITRFSRQAKKAGATVILVPVPGKAALYPEALDEKLPPDAHAEFYDQLRKEGIVVIDILPILRKLRADGIDTHCRTDSHWTPAAMQAAASAVAETIGRHAGATCKEETLTITGDLPGMLGQTPPDEKITLKRPLINGEQPLTDDEKSPVVLMGDSHAFVYSIPISGGIQAKGAGFGECLAAEIGSSVDCVATAGSGANASRLTLARRKDNLAGKKWLVWCFAIREFSQATQGWKDIPVVRE